jgi:hypothetical protein
MTNLNRYMLAVLCVCFNCNDKNSRSTDSAQDLTTQCRATQNNNAWTQRSINLSSAGIMSTSSEDSEDGSGDNLATNERETNQKRFRNERQTNEKRATQETAVTRVSASETASKKTCFDCCRTRSVFVQLISESACVSYLCLFIFTCKTT